MPIIENITLQEGNDIILHFDVDAADLPVVSPPVVPTLQGATVYWWLSTQQFGVPGDVIVMKDNAGIGGVTIVDDVAMTFTVDVSREDIDNLVSAGRTSQGYYHEAWMEDSDGNRVTVTKGIVTIEKTLAEGASP